jgi:hypothetical protein
MRFIIWDNKDGKPHKSDDGTGIISGGIMGWLDANSVYLTTYASYPDARRPADLEVGACLPGVRWTLSGEVGIYDIYRVR